MFSCVTYIWIYCLALTVLHIRMCIGLGGPLGNGTWVTCEEEGAPVVIEIAANNPCIKCYCKSGIVTCVHKDCPDSEGCHNIITPAPADSCCKEVCLGCMYKNMTIKSGETVTDSTDPCITLECNGGVLTHSTTTCITGCKEPVYIPGKCCPVCQGCVYKGKTYADGLKFSDNKDPCMICKCNGGYIECSKRACAQLNCPNSFLRPPEDGRCCSTCTGKRGLVSLKDKCLYHPSNTVYSDGDVILTDNCQTCSCQKGTVVCFKKTCPRLKCTANKWIQPGLEDCCPRCPPPKKKCKVDNKKMKHGATWFLNQCSHCKCNDGVTHCSQEDCSSVIAGCPKRTHELQYIAGLCCPQCIEISATCFVFGDPHYRTFDGVLYTFQGGCQYTLAQQCSRSKRTFSIQVKNSVWPDKTRYAYTNSVLIETKYLKIELKQKLRVQVDSQDVELPFIKLGHISVIQRGYSLMVSTYVGVTVIWDGLSYVEVSVPQRYKNKMCGLCGNYNGISEDDFTGRYKTSYSTAVDFANSWQKDQSTCGKSSNHNAIPPISCASTDYMTLTWIRNRCEKLKQYIVASQCRTIEDIVVYYSQCIDKLCTCIDPENCYCQSVNLLLKVCEPHDTDFEFGHDIKSICYV